MELTQWHWFIGAMVLLALEVLAPGAFFMWLGFAALAVGLVVWLLPALAWSYQVLLFALFAVVSIALWRRVQKRHPERSDQPTLNRRGQQYVGRVFTLAEPIVNGSGKIRVDDTTWKVHGDDVPEGTRIKVVAADGVVLRVEPV